MVYVFYNALQSYDLLNQKKVFNPYLHRNKIKSSLSLHVSELLLCNF